MLSILPIPTTPNTAHHKSNNDTVKRRYCIPSRETGRRFSYAQNQKGGDTMNFTSGPDRAFERLMQEKPGFDHYDGGGADAPEDCYI